MGTAFKDLLIPSLPIQAGIPSTRDHVAQHMVTHLLGFGLIHSSK